MSSVSLTCAPNLAILLITSNSLWHATTYPSALQSIAPPISTIFSWIQHVLWHWHLWLHPRLVALVWLVGECLVSFHWFVRQLWPSSVRHLAAFDTHNIRIYLVNLCSFQWCCSFINPALLLTSPLFDLAPNSLTMGGWSTLFHWSSRQLWPSHVQHPVAFDTSQYTRLFYNSLHFPMVPSICESDIIFDTYFLTHSSQTSWSCMVQESCAIGPLANFCSSSVWHLTAIGT